MKKLKPGKESRGGKMGNEISKHFFSKYKFEESDEYKKDIAAQTLIL